MSDLGNCHNFGTRWRLDKSGWSDISILGSDMFDLAVLPRFCDPMKMSDLVGYIRLRRHNRD
jgi:hypothetical protein